MSDKAIVGVDVSKGWLDLCVGGSEASERIETITMRSEGGLIGFGLDWSLSSRPAVTSAA